MIKKLTLAFAALVGCALLSAQAPTGGVKGTVVDRNGRQPVEKATLTLYKGAVEVAVVESDENGNFLIPAVADGMYDLVITAPEFLSSTVNVTVNGKVTASTVMSTSISNGLIVYLGSNEATITIS